MSEPAPKALDGVTTTNRSARDEDRITRPHIKLVGLHVRGLRAIRALDLPADGIGWNGSVPDVMLLGGINGSGKTTLLRFLADALELFEQESLTAYPIVHLAYLAATNAWADFEVETNEQTKSVLRFLVGDEGFIRVNRTDNCWFLTGPSDGRSFSAGSTGVEFNKLLKMARAKLGKTTAPAVLHFPSENRTLVTPDETFKAAGKIARDEPFVCHWRPPAEWKDSLEALLYSMRWEDLNAKEEGRLTEAGNFEAYAVALRRFTGDTKTIQFEHGELVVKIANSPVTHGLSELSSGEKQVLLLSGEILRRWRPGSLVLIDEPELHLHSTWQTKFYEALCYWQNERGGQVILATQSSHLFEIAGAGSAALLGMEPL